MSIALPYMSLNQGACNVSSVSPPPTPLTGHSPRAGRYRILQPLSVLPGSFKSVGVRSKNMDTADKTAQTSLTEPPRICSFYVSFKNMLFYILLCKVLTDDM